LQEVFGERVRFLRFIQDRGRRSGAVDAFVREQKRAAASGNASLVTSTGAGAAGKMWTPQSVSEQWQAFLHSSRDASGTIIYNKSHTKMQLDGRDEEHGVKAASPARPGPAVEGENAEGKVLKATKTNEEPRQPNARVERELALRKGRRMRELELAGEQEQVRSEKKTEDVKKAKEKEGLYKKLADALGDQYKKFMSSTLSDSTGSHKHDDNEPSKDVETTKLPDAGYWLKQFDDLKNSVAVYLDKRAAVARTVGDKAKAAAASKEATELRKRYVNSDESFEKFLARIFTATPEVARLRSLLHANLSREDMHALMRKDAESAAAPTQAASTNEESESAVKTNIATPGT
ncbi:unnamed protein product, partial [Amoebophrya sp. A25]